MNAETNEASMVRMLYEKLLESWNKYQARDYADLFAEDGSLIGFDGSQVNGREAIYAHLSGIFAHHKPASYVHVIREIRFLSPGIAILRAVAGMVPPGGSDINPAVNAIQTLIVSRQHEQYKIAVFQNTPAAFHGRPELSEQLTEELRQVLKNR